MTMQSVTIQAETRGTYEEAAASNSRKAQNELLRPEYKRECDALVRGLVERSSRLVAPHLAKLTTPDAIKRFFIRSTIENVRRIDNMRKINPMVSIKLAPVDAVLCKQWTLYAADEGLHSRMFARDLHTMGVGDDEIYSTPLLFATELVMGYLLQTLAEEGPLSVMTQAYYVESIAELTQPGWLTQIEQVLGVAATRGSRGHLSLDQREEHIDMAWNMCMKVVTTPEAEARFVAHIKRNHALLTAYVLELFAILNDTSEGHDDVARHAVELRVG